MLSLGVDCVGPGPKAADYNPAKPQYSSAYHLNESYEVWRDRSMGRLESWGFNTLAGWCDASLSSTGKAFAPVLHIQASMGSIWWDLWGSDYEGKAKALAVKTTAPYRGNKMLLGYFLDNEMAWSGEFLLNIALGWDAKAPGKGHLVEILKKLYASDFGRFQSDFETRAKDWDALVGLTDTARRDGHGSRAVDAWTYEVARRYYTVCSAAVRKADPGKLILGDRFRQSYPQAVARAAKGVLDAISTNYEATTTDGWVSPCYFETLHQLAGLPVIVGEFYTAARQNRSGNKNHGDVFTLVDTQAQRAQAAAAQANAFAAFPFVVGWHWFQFNDEPSYGRDDGEDYNMGLVDIYDRPYEEITKAFTVANAQAPKIHSIAAVTAPGLRPFGVARQSGLKADGKLGDWDKTRPVPREWISMTAGVLPFGEIWLAWDEGNLWVATRAYGFSSPGRQKPLSNDEASWGEMQRLSVTAQGVTACSFYGASTQDEAEHAFFYNRLPPKGHLQCAIGSAVDKWYAVWELALPASELGSEALKSGAKIRLDLQLRNRGDLEEMGLTGLELVLQ